MILLSFYTIFAKGIDRQQKVCYNGDVQFTEIKNKEKWNKLVEANGGHPLQLWGWGETKAAEGNWRAYRIWAEGFGGAQVLVRRLPGPLRRMAYIPRGPIFVQEFLNKRVESLSDLRDTGLVQDNLNSEDDGVGQDFLNNGFDLGQDNLNNSVNSNGGEDGSERNKIGQEFLNKLTEWARRQGCIELKIEMDEFSSKILDLMGEGSSNIFEQGGGQSSDVSSKFFELEREGSGSSLSGSKFIELEQRGRSKIFEQRHKNRSGNFELNRGWRWSKNRILINQTAVLDLTKGEDELLAAMTKKTRQYIRKSSREDVTIRRVADAASIKRCLRVYKVTAERAKFALHTDKYYLNLAKMMGENGQIYVAEQGGEVLSFLWNVTTPEVSFELYGGVTDEGQRLRVNYALKWQVIRECQKNGVRRYDMNGLLNDGVSGFKLGFTGGVETELVPTMDAPLSIWYGVWEGLVPIGKRVARLIKR
jgi:hypothetical protein